VAVPQDKIRRQEAERRRKQRAFLNKLIKMKTLGVTDVLRKFEKFMRERGEGILDLAFSALSSPRVQLVS
jgi:hypothetical protein